jgi:1,4-dihydroxy-2-naphthoate octaprenyltransferase
MFFGIIVCPVTHPNLWVEILHLIFTGAAIVSAYTEMLFVYERKPEKWGNVLGVVAGCIGFSLGFFFDLYSISTAEVLAALPIAVYVLSTNK